MKKILAGVCLAAVLGVAVWRAPCTQWQCDRIVDRAVAEYGIEVPDTADARTADEFVNTAGEAMAVLQKINAERYKNFQLGAGKFAARADYLDTLQLDKAAFKAQLERELDEGTTGGLVERLGIEDCG